MMTNIVNANDTITLQRGIARGRIHIRAKVKMAIEKAGTTKKATIRGLSA
jgi:hypothetical protein